MNWFSFHSASHEKLLKMEELQQNVENNVQMHIRTLAKNFKDANSMGHTATQARLPNATKIYEFYDDENMNIC